MPVQFHQPDTIHHKGLIVYPLFTPDGHESKSELLEDALKNETALVTEASTESKIPELIIENRGDKPILILEDDVLIGFTHSRTVSITVLVPAMTNFSLPLSCVERGRWRYMSPKFAEFAYSDQLTEFRERCRLPEGATGFYVSLHHSFVGMDLFGDARTAARCWDRLGEFYFIEALRGSHEIESSGLIIDWVPPVVDFDREFMTGVCREIRLRDNAAGLGREIEVVGRNLAGMGLSWEDRIVHLAVFPSLDVDY